jgi:hypothetical protein
MGLRASRKLMAQARMDRGSEGAYGMSNEAALAQLGIQTKDFRRLIPITGYSAPHGSPRRCREQDHDGQRAPGSGNRYRLEKIKPGLGQGLAALA